MAVADIVRLGLAERLTNQQLADLALVADRAARVAKRNGQGQLAACHDRESAALLALLR